MTAAKVAVAIVGKDQPFTMLQGDVLAPFLAQLEAEAPAQDAGGDEGGGDEGAAPMEA